MDVLITDVTEMHHGNYCVAGWNTAAQRMIRPLPARANWTAGLLAQNGIGPGITLRVAPQGLPTGDFPHRTEDTPVDASAIVVVGRGFSDWLRAGEPALAADLAAAFDGHLEWNSEWNSIRQGVYVRAGIRCRSLVAIRVERAQIRFSDEFHRLKAMIRENSGIYQLAVSSRVLKEAWREGGVQAVIEALPTRDSFCVRVGLARPFGNPPDKCYLMVNGVL